ncbi:rubredoxin [Methylotetracoccus oryzae]|uniref:rubredoxin n=1 Tax=Methylotetracoccus oryzae TaxID=1919059 RepID=UPI001117FEB4|nr:rubredoxin [Methylotetracoccus oryzae]
MFENCGLGPDVAENARLECGVCWWVYDPAEGDPSTQVPPGTPFSHLPDHWRCPQCDGAPEKFLVVRDER